MKKFIFLLFISFFLVFAALAHEGELHSAEQTNSFINFLIEYHEFVLLFHIIGVILGIGGATITDTLFFKFLKDFKISPKEDSVLETISGVIWVAIAILVLTGLGLYLPQAGALNSSPEFLLKMIIVGIIIVNGIILNLVIAPRLKNINFRKKLTKWGKLRTFRRLAFASGAVSITSWYGAFFVASLKNVMDYSVLFWGYFGVLALAVIISQLSEYLMSKEAIKSFES